MFCMCLFGKRLSMSYMTTDSSTIPVHHQIIYVCNFKISQIQILKTHLIFKAKSNLTVNLNNCEETSFVYCVYVYKWLEVSVHLPFFL